MKKYEINEYGVCENPDTEIIFQSGPITAKIHLAQKEGAWAYGYNFKIKGGGTGCFEAGAYPGFSKYRPKFTSQNEAREEAIKLGIEYFRDASNFHNVRNVVAALKNAITPKQLSLF